VAEYVDRAAANVKWLRSFFGGYIQAENLNYFPTGAYETVCEPDFIWRVTGVAGVGLLLDLAHAIISAHHLGYKEPWSYVESLPLDRVHEVHISHCSFQNGILEDLHEAPGEYELSLVKQIIEAGHKIQYLTVEYYRNADALCSAYSSIGRAFGISSQRV
jgi:uncharacterized protein (UPF0276 family)